MTFDEWWEQYLNDPRFNHGLSRKQTWVEGVQAVVKQAAQEAWVMCAIETSKKHVESLAKAIREL